MPMARHLLYLQAMHFLLATLMLQAPALSLHLATSLRWALRLKKARHE